MDGLRILIVDDEVELVSALEERLNLRGFQAKGVTAGAEALSYIANTPCDVVLEVIRRIKEERPLLNVILLTGHGSAQDVEKGMALGAFDYLMKPVDIDVLVRTLLNAAEGEKKGEPHA